MTNATSSVPLWTLISLAATISVCGAQEKVPSSLPSSYHPTEDIKFLQSSGIKTDNQSLLNHFRNRIPTKEDGKKVTKLVKQLADPDFRIRADATKTLKTMGERIRPYLQKAVESDDPEVRRRARDVLRTIKSPSRMDIDVASVRLLAQRNPKGTTATLLAFSPQVKENDHYLLEALRDALITLAAQNKANSALLQAVNAEQERERAMAIESLIRANALNFADGKKHLDDKSALVRLRAALAFAEKGNKEAVPVLVRLLAELSLDTVWQAENMLFLLAGDNCPQAPLDNTRASRTKAKAKWMAWWDKNKDTIDLAVLKDRARFLGLTLVAMRDNRGQGTVGEMSNNGKMRWQIGNLRYPMDAQMLPNGNVLIAERSSSRVTERTKQGKIIWSYSISSPTACSRLRNGSTMVAGYRELKVLDQNKKVVMQYQSNQGNIYAARPMRDGGFLVWNSSERLVRLDSKGKQVSSTFVSGTASSYSSIDILPNGHVLVALYSNSRVVEVDLKGKVHKTITSVRYPTSAQRLPNGRTLISSYSLKKLYEVNAAGKVVKETPMEGSMWHASRR